MGYEYKKIYIPDILTNPNRRDRYLYKDGYLSGFEKRYKKKHDSDYWKDVRKICKLSKSIKISIRDEIESGQFVFLRCKYLRFINHPLKIYKFFWLYYIPLFLFLLLMQNLI